MILRAAVVLLVGISSASHAWTLRATSLGGWASSTITVQYNLAGCTRPTAEILGMIDNAIAVWNVSQNSGLVLTRASAPTTATAADVTALTASPTPVFVCDTGFTANQSVDGNQIPALTRLGAVSSRIAFAGIVLNAESGKLADIGAMSATQVSVAIAHELGHALGLGHSGDSRALMYYSIAGKADSITTQDDMDGIAYLYPRNEFAGGLYGCASVHGAPKPSSHFVWIYLAIFFVFNLTLGRLWIRLKSEPLL